MILFERGCDYLMLITAKKSLTRAAVALILAVLMVVGMSPVYLPMVYAAAALETAENAYYKMLTPVVQKSDVIFSASRGEHDLEEGDAAELEKFNSMVCEPYKQGEVIWVPIAIKSPRDVNAACIAIAYDTTKYEPFTVDPNDSVSTAAAQKKRVVIPNPNMIDDDSGIFYIMQQWRNSATVNFTSNVVADDPVFEDLERTNYKVVGYTAAGDTAFENGYLNTNGEELLSVYYRFKALNDGTISKNDFKISGITTMSEPLGAVIPTATSHNAGEANLLEYFKYELNLPKVATAVAAPAPITVNLGTSTAALEADKDTIGADGTGGTGGNKLPNRVKVSWADGEADTWNEVTWDFAKAVATDPSLGAATAKAYPTTDAKAGEYWVPGNITKANQDDDISAVSVYLKVTVSPSTITAVDPALVTRKYYQGQVDTLDTATLYTNNKATPTADAATYAGTALTETGALTWTADSTAFNGDTIGTYNYTGKYTEVKAGNETYSVSTSGDFTSAADAKATIEVVAKPAITADIDAGEISVATLGSLTLDATSDEIIAELSKLATTVNAVKDTHFTYAADITDVASLPGNVPVKMSGTWELVGSFNPAPNASNTFRKQITAADIASDAILTAGTGKYITVDVVLNGTAITSIDTPAAVDVSYNTSEADAKAKLPASLSFTGENGAKGTIAVTWTADTYTAAAPGKYTFKPTFGAITPGAGDTTIGYYVDPAETQNADLTATVNVHTALNADITAEENVELPSESTLQEVADIPAYLAGLADTAPVAATSYIADPHQVGATTAKIGGGTWTVVAEDAAKTKAPGAEIRFEKTLADADLACNDGLTGYHKVAANSKKLIVTVKYSETPITADGNILSKVLTDAEQTLNVDFGTTQDDVLAKLAEIPTARTYTQDGKTIGLTIGTWSYTGAGDGYDPSTAGAYEFTAPVTVTDSDNPVSDLVMPGEGTYYVKVVVTVGDPVTLEPAVLAFDKIQYSAAADEIKTMIINAVTAGNVKAKDGTADITLDWKDAGDTALADKIEVAADTTAMLATSNRAVYNIADGSLKAYTMTVPMELLKVKDGTAEAAKYAVAKDLTVSFTLANELKSHNITAINISEADEEAGTGIGLEVAYSANATTDQALPAGATLILTFADAGSIEGVLTKTLTAEELAAGIITLAEADGLTQDMLDAGTIKVILVSKEPSATDVGVALSNQFVAQ